LKLCLRLDQSRAGFVLERIFGDVGQFIKRSGVGSSDVSDDFAVERALGSLEAFDEAAVGESGRAGGGIDADLPEITELALFAAAVAVGVLPSVIHSVRRVAIQFGTAHPEAFGGADHPGAAFAGSRGVGNSHKIWGLGSGVSVLGRGKSVAERQILRDTVGVGGIHTGQSAQGAAAFGILGLRQMAAARAGAQNFSASRNLKAFGHGLFGFNAFGTSHKNLKISIAKERALYLRKRPGASLNFPILASQPLAIV